MTAFLSYLILAFLLLPFAWYGWCAWHFFGIVFRAITWRVLNVIIWVWGKCLSAPKEEEITEEDEKSTLHVGDELGWQ